MGYYGYIYYTQNVVNNKSYVGQSTRFGKYEEWYLGSGKYITRAINKYGRHSFTKKILSCYSSQEELDLAEQMYIAILNPEYNISRGGFGAGKMSDNTKKLLSDLHFGVEASIETRMKMSVVHRRENLSASTIEKLRITSTGRTASAETRAKLSSAKMGHSVSEENLAKMIEAAKKKVCKRVLCIETNEVFSSAAHVARSTVYDASSISKCCRGVLPRAYNLHWKYLDDPITNNNNLIPTSTAIN